ncbi:MAG: hypothetical protein M3447_03465 [Acidobacteriota bacterium]|nr:hypothetical protein [Acidobacteriota bacterium]
MSGFAKGLLVTGIVFGVIQLLWAIYLLIRPKSRTRGIQSLLRSVFQIIVSSAALYFLRDVSLDDFSLTFLLVGVSAVTLGLEVVLQRTFRTALSSEPLTAKEWNERKVSKSKFVLVITLPIISVPVITAIVFTIVAPEAVGLLWWIFLIVALSLVAFFFALRFWNENERRFGSQTTPSR